MAAEEQAMVTGDESAQAPLDPGRARRRTDPPDREELARLFAERLGWGPFHQNPLGSAIFEFLTEAAAGCDEGTVVLEVSAGDCRYEPFFRHARYLAVDSAAGDPALDPSRLDLLGDTAALPIKSESVDVCLNLAGLERSPEPERAFLELSRVLRPGGELYLYVPCCLAENQAGQDFHRFTRHALARLTERSGLLLRTLRPTNGIYYTSLHLLAQAIQTVHDPSTHARLTELKDRIAPILLDLDRGADAAVGYPVTSATPQLPTAYCLRAVRPGRATRARGFGGRRDLVQEVAACPRCHGNLIWWNDRSVCAHCGIGYTTIDDVPDLTPRDASPAR